jgi:dTDP-glucose 4,6-dehydratase
MRILVTGGAGFIGSAVVRRAIGAGHDVLTFDKLTYAGRREALTEVAGSPRHQFVQADIADRDAVEEAFADFDPDVVLHLAAESHVDRSIDGPAVFIETNIAGTFVLLEAALRHWSRAVDNRRESFRFVQVSTDEVFGTLGATGTFARDSRYAPNSPYAASKAAGDHFARAWHRTYGLPVIVTNSSNNYGPWQHAEKLIPTVIRYALAGRPIPIYGTGTNVRDWLHVEDHAAGLLAVAERGQAGDTYLFGGRCEVANRRLAEMICLLLDARCPRADGRSYAHQITFVRDRPGHDSRYALDPSDCERTLGWRNTVALQSGLAATVDWYLANSAWLTPVEELGRLGTRRAAPAGADS